MASPRTPEENANAVLAIYAHFHSQPGHALRANNFVAVAARRHIPMADIQNGLEYATRMKWIEPTENGSLRLTARGFEAMPQPGQSN
jgi:hypothetical protein